MHCDRARPAGLITLILHADRGSVVSQRDDPRDCVLERDYDEASFWMDGKTRGRLAEIHDLANLAVTCQVAELPLAYADDRPVVGDAGSARVPLWWRRQLLPFSRRREQQRPR